MKRVMIFHDVNDSQKPELSAHRDARHVLTFRREYGDAVAGALLLHEGEEVLPLAEGVLAVPWWRVI